MVTAGPDRLKIGLSDNPEKRLRGLLTSSAEPLLLAHVWRLRTRAQAAALERELHVVFTGRRLAREWFSLQPAHVVAVGDAAIAGEGTRANLLANAIALALDCDDMAERKTRQAAGLAPRWYKARRDALAAEADASAERAGYWWAWAHYFGHSYGVTQYEIHCDRIAAALASAPA